jgi:hypothetical protein
MQELKSHLALPHFAENRSASMGEILETPTFAERNLIWNDRCQHFDLTKLRPRTFWTRRVAIATPQLQNVIGLSWVAFRGSSQRVP